MRDLDGETDDQKSREQGWDQADMTPGLDDVRLVVADVDGTLLTPDKILTPRARAAVRTIIEAGLA